MSAATPWWGYHAQQPINRPTVQHGLQATLAVCKHTHFFLQHANDKLKHKPKQCHPALVTGP